VLVRGKLWKNTSEERWERPSEQENFFDSSVESLVRRLAGADRNVRRSAAKSLGELGTDATLAIPALLKAAVDVDATVREAAMGALNSVDPAWPEKAEVRKACPDLLAALRSWSSDVKKAAMKLLSLIGPSAVPDLAAVLLDGEDTVGKVYVMQLLERVGPKAASAVPGLTQALDSQYVTVRTAAAKALANIGPPAGTAVPKLVVGLADTNAEARQAMATCLARVGPAAEPAAPALLPLLADREYKVREAAAEALAQIGPQAIPALIEIVQTRDVQRLKMLIDSMIKVSPWYTQPKPDIVVTDPRKIINSRIWVLFEIVEERTKLEAAQKTALQVLGKLGPAASAAVPAATEALADQNPAIRLAAVQTLGKIGPSASAAVPQLIQALMDSNPDVKLAAIQSLGQIGSLPRSAIAGLIQMLVDSNKSVQKEAAEVLRNLDNVEENWASDPVVTDAIAGLAKQLGKPGGLAVHAFTVIGTAAIPVLVDTLESGNRVARENAAVALGDIGAGAKAAIPALTRALEDDHRWVQDKAAKALAKIENLSA
jgi:HEAT repeat protein